MIDPNLRHVIGAEYDQHAVETVVYGSAQAALALVLV